MKTGVFLCTCSGTINIDFKKLKKGIAADVVEIQDMFCRDVDELRDKVKLYELGRALITCTNRRQVFEQLDLQSINIREHCAEVHEKRDATEKARMMINAALSRPQVRGKIIVDVGRDVLIAGEISTALRLAQDLSRIGNVHVLSRDAGTSGMLPGMTGGIRVHAGIVRDMEGRIGDFRVNIAGNPIDDDRCISCGRCMDACRLHAICDHPVHATTKECNGCGDCIDVCPVHAISFKDNIKTIRAGQILVIGNEYGDIIPHKKGIFVTPRGESAEDTFRNALPAALEMMSNMGSIEMDKSLSVSGEGCASGKSGLIGCRLCENVCLHGGIDRSGDSIIFDEISCGGCGACASVCPLSVPQLKPDIYSEMEHLLNDPQLSPNILMFACAHSIPLLDAAGRERIQYPPVLPLFLPSTAGVSEAHVLRAFDLGVDGVIILGCPDCLSGNAGALELAGLILKDFGLDGRVIAISSSRGSFAITATAFSEGLTPSPLRRQEPLVLQKSGKRQIMLRLLNGFAAKTHISPGLMIEDTEHPFAGISINRKCTVCGACTAMCPTGALRRGDGAVRFTHAQCIACGLCEKACPESALKTRRILDLRKLIDTTPETLIEVEMQVCAACKKPYMTASAFDRITESLIVNVRSDISPQEQIKHIKDRVELLKYCDECRPSLAISKMEMFS